MLLPVASRRVVKLLIGGGSLLFALGALLDVAAHLLPVLGALPLGAVTFETAAHIVTLAGMVVLLLALVGKASQPPAQRATAPRVQERRPPQ